MEQTTKIDPGTERAVRAFIVRVAGQYDLAGAVLFGSRARGNFHPGSDADIAVLLHGVPGRRVDAALKMADIAFDVMLETKTHRGLIAAFGEHLVKTARLTADLGKALNQVERIRLLADYTGEVVAADKARWAVDRIRRDGATDACAAETDARHGASGITIHEQR